jgi:hypothetical protein
MIDSKKNLITEWDKIKDDEIVQIEIIKETRSRAQNRLYHKWITDLCRVFDDK